MDEKLSAFPGSGSGESLSWRLCRNCAWPASMEVGIRVVITLIATPVVVVVFVAVLFPHFSYVFFLFCFLFL